MSHEKQKRESSIRKRISKPTAVAFAALAFAGVAKSAESAENPMSSPVITAQLGHQATGNKASKPKIPRVRLPEVRNDTYVELRADAREAGYTKVPKIIRNKTTKSFPRAKEGFEWRAIHWATQKKVPIKKNGKPTGKAKTIYKTVNEGAKLPRNTQLYFRARQVPEGSVGVGERDEVATPIQTIREQPPAPPEAQEKINSFLAERTVYIDGRGCTGENISPSLDKFILFTQEHCVSTSNDPNIKVGQLSDGSNYMQFPSMPFAYNGYSPDDFNTVGVPTKLFAPSLESPTGYADVALLTAGNVSKEEAIQVYMDGLITGTEFSQLEKGARVYTAGYPAASYEGLRRVTASMVYLGGTDGVFETQAGDVPPMMFGITKEASAESAGVCTPGYSGAPVYFFNELGENPRRLGNVEGVIDFENPEFGKEIRKSFEDYSGIDTTSYRGICFTAVLNPRINLNDNNILGPFDNPATHDPNAAKGGSPAVSMK